jgi:hypothetical protein
MAERQSLGMSRCNRTERCIEKIRKQDDVEHETKTSTAAHTMAHRPVVNGPVLGADMYIYSTKGQS